VPKGYARYVLAVMFGINFLNYMDRYLGAAVSPLIQKDFHLSDDDLANLKAAGGTAAQGSATGLGDNSIVLSIDVAGVSVYIAVWENKTFEVAEVAFNDATDAKAAVTKINGRIR